jgi:hypothetical protein
MVEGPPSTIHQSAASRPNTWFDRRLDAGVGALARLHRQAEGRLVEGASFSSMRLRTSVKWSVLARVVRREDVSGRLNGIG